MTETTIEQSRISEPVPAASIAGRPPRQWRCIAQRLAFWAVIVAIGFSAVLAGLVLRRWAWEQTEDIRFTSDIDNAFRQGSLTLRQGYIDRYVVQSETHNVDGEYDFDYAPARLLIARLWVKHVRTMVDGPARNWSEIDDWPPFYETARQRQQTYAWCKPLLNLNATGEVIAAVGIFFLTRRWTGRKSCRARLGPGASAYRIPMTSIRFSVDRAGVKGAMLGLVAALFFWFNLELIWNAHCWPQWDSWLLPFFIWALVAASDEWWFVAGMLIAAGMMFKAQILFGAPALVLWPLWRGKLLAIVKFLTGAATATAGLTAVWLVRGDQAPNHHAVMWVVGMAVALVSLAAILRWKWDWYVWAPAALVASTLVVWPLVSMGLGWIAAAIVGLIAVSVMLRYLPWRAMGYLAAGWVATALFLCVPVFGGSMGWFQVGVEYGTYHFPNMMRGVTDNLAAILADQYHWEAMEPAMTVEKGKTADVLGKAFKFIDSRFFFAPGDDLQIPLKYICFAVYLAGMLICTIGMAIQSSRASPRFLVAVAAPWIWFFAVNLQMHERYLLWGATLSSMAVAISPGFALLHLLLTCIGWSQEALNMIRHSGGGGDGWAYRVVAGWTPGIGWALMLCAGIFMYFAVMPERRRKYSREI